MVHLTLGMWSLWINMRLSEKLWMSGRFGMTKRNAILLVSNMSSFETVWRSTGGHGASLDLIFNNHLNGESVERVIGDLEDETFIQLFRQLTGVPDSNLRREIEELLVNLAQSKFSLRNYSLRNGASLWLHQNKVVFTNSKGEVIPQYPVMQTAIQRLITTCKLLFLSTLTF